MITEKESFPSKLKGYRNSLDIFYVQFNDIFFYVEDEENENFYYSILRKLFPGIRLDKIIPLNGKVEVIEHSIPNYGNNSKIYLLDKDFDDVFNKIIDRKNIFYLSRYSIENFLLEEEALVEFIITQDPRLDKDDVRNGVNIEDLVNNIGSCLERIIYLFLVIQYHDLGIINVGSGPNRFVEYNEGFEVDQHELALYEAEINQELENVDGRYSLNGRLNKMRRLVRIDNLESYKKHIPGKFIIKMIKSYVEINYNLNSTTLDSGLAPKKWTGYPVSLNRFSYSVGVR